MIIGILGEKYSGKDTMADYIVMKYNYKKIIIAEPLKEICRILFNFTDEQLYGNLKEEVDENWNVSPRKIYQYLGTDVFRNNINNIIPNINQNFWIKLVTMKHSINTNTVISDVRFQNEIDYIHSLGGIVVKLIRNNNDEEVHESEAYIKNLKGDYEINNNGTLNDLWKEIDIFFLKN